MLFEEKIRAELDSRDNYSLERKYSEWEMKGVPLIIEIGANKQVINVVMLLHLYSFICHYAFIFYAQCKHQ
jgi:prolyl-tRNA synthetase